MSDLAKNAIEILLPFLKSQAHLDLTLFNEEAFKQYIIETNLIACPLIYGGKCNEWMKKNDHNAKKQNCLTCKNNAVHQCKHLAKYDTLIQKEFITEQINLWDQGYSLLRIVGKINQNETQYY
jgi:hypothetical protein